ncbi:LAMI_0F08680g1_1 [Lachancea mirantina]|uniref:LAMI_0F08680g1_1 n=1 Tax=Lachancea mirantina TaxID=1230905 RepID=A0A1G4K0I2_9SACH|nr:LAMI_0F08680g1_1 [Lachancea mirantina]
MEQHAKQAKRQAKDATAEAEQQAAEMAKELRAEAREVREEAEKALEEAQEPDGLASQACSALRALRAQLVAAARGAARRGAYAGSWVAHELQNPVVAGNVALGAGAAVWVLRGYAKHQARYLKGRSDSGIIAAVAGVAALLATDVYVSSKYYARFDKSVSK